MITKRTITQWVLLVKEKGETEVKKDIEWAKNKIDLEVIRRIGREDPHFYVNVGLKMALDFLNQLDEPEVLSQGEIINIVLDDLKEHIKEQQSLSQNVGMAHTPAGNDTHYRQYDYVLECINEYEPSDDLQNLLMPKQEEVKRAQIPEWIIGWYQGANNEFSTLEDVFDNLSHDTGYSIVDSDKFRSRIMKYGGYSKMYEALSHIYFGVYEIEEEQKYFAKIKGHENISSDDKYWNYCITDESLDIGDNKVHADVLDEYVLNASKDEWENLGINDDNADFVKVEELEE